MSYTRRLFMHPLKASELSVLAYANNFTLWHYFTHGTIADVTQEGYFSKAQDMMRKDDLIITNTSEGTVFLIVGENTSVTIK